MSENLLCGDTVICESTFLYNEWLSCVMAHRVQVVFHCERLRSVLEGETFNDSLYFPRRVHTHDWMYKWLVARFVSSLIRRRRSFYFRMTFVSSPPLITKRFCQVWFTDFHPRWLFSIRPGGELVTVLVLMVTLSYLRGSSWWFD